MPVSGRVVLGDQPLKTGTVSFRPDKARGNQTLHQPTGVIDRDGSYKVYTTEREGAPPGWYKVIVFASSQADERGQVHPGMPQSIIDVRYNDPAKTPLAVEVKADGPVDGYDLRLER